MSIPYIIISSDSEDEIDSTPTNIILPDLNNESSHTTSDHIIKEESEEEDPEEEDPEEEDPEIGDTIPETPPLSLAIEPQPVQTAMKQIPPQWRRLIPEPGTNPHMASNMPTPTAHQRTDARKWTWIPNTLQTWREEEGFPTITEVGESSTTGQDYPFTREPPHHTIPLLVARMASQEHRIEHTENNLEEMPGQDAVADLQNQMDTMEHRIEGRRLAHEELEEEVTNLEYSLNVMRQTTENDVGVLEDHLIAIQGDIEELKAKMAINTRKIGELTWIKDQFNHMRNEFDSMAARLKGLESMIYSCDIIPKKKKGE